MAKGDTKKEKILNNYIDNLIAKGYKKKDIRDHLVGAGYNKVLINKHLYPYLPVLVIFGIILISMILITGAIVGFYLIKGDVNIKGASADTGTSLGESKGIIVESVDIKGNSGESVSIEITLKNTESTDFNEFVEIKVVSGGYSSDWIDPRPIPAGTTIISTIDSFLLDGEDVQVSLNGELAFTKII